MVRVVAYGVAAILATLVVAEFAPRLIEFDDAETVVLFGLVIGLLNAVIKPVIKVLTIPITCLTFGLFALVINAGMFALGSYLTPGITMEWLGAGLASILTSLISGLVYSVVDE